MVGLLPHVFQQEQKDKVEFAVPVIEDKPMVHSLQIGEFYDASDALITEIFAAVVNKAVNE